MKIRVMRLALAVSGLSALAGSGAWADVIAPVNTQSGLSPNDQVSWATQLGPDGAIITQNFSATSNSGLAVGGSFSSGGGQVCDTNGDTCFTAFDDYSIEASNGTGGTGPLTLTFAGVYGVGTNIINNIASQNLVQFTASLALYNGTTLLGTATGTSDAFGDPFYLGAVDQTGPDVTSAVFTVTSIGTPAVPIDVSYDWDVAGTDPAECEHDAPSTFKWTTKAGVTAILTCPRAASKALGGIGWPMTVPIAVAATGSFPNISQTVIYDGQNTADTSPSDLADFFVDAVDLSVATTADATNTPEPGTLLIFSSGLVGLGFRRMIPRGLISGR
jgi:PEP-CTERM motif